MKTQAKGSEFPPFHRRAGALAGACIIVAAIIVFAYAGSSWAVLLYELLTDGLICLVWLAAAGGMGALLLCSTGVSPVPERRSGTGETLVLHVIVTFVALGLGIMSLAVLGLGLLGWFNRITAIAMIVVGLLAWIPVWKKLRFAMPAQASNENWLGVLVMPFLGIMIVAAMMPPGILWKPDDPHPYDVMEYHLQVPREWYEAGQITPLQHNAFSYFPFNMEMHYLAAMHLRGSPWSGMYLCQLMHLSFVALTVAALWSSAGALAALAAASAPWPTMLGGIAYDEGALLLFGTLSIIWLLRAIEQNDQGRARAIALAGALGGFACGAKLTAVVAVVLAGAIALAIVLRKRAVVPILVFGFASLLTFSPWLIRTAIWSGGNPVFPEAMPLLGRGHFSNAQVERWQAAHSPTESEQGILNRLTRFRERVIFDWRYGFAILPIGIAALGLGRSSRSPGTPGQGMGGGNPGISKNPLPNPPPEYRRRGSEVLALVLAVNFIFWLGFTHLQSRFFALAIPISALLIARVELRAIRCAFAGLLIVACVVSFVHLHRAFVRQPLDLMGVEQISAMLPFDLRALPPDKELQLAGDAAAFWYQMPMSRLRYRTVFDVDAKPGQGPIQAWTDGWPKNQMILVSPQELVRFAQTYKGIPAPSVEIAQRDMPYFLSSSNGAGAGE